MATQDYVSPPRVVGHAAVYVEHRVKRPQVAESAYIAPTAVLCGDVKVGPHSRVLFGAVLTAEGGSVEIGANCVVMENAVIRGVPLHPAKLGDNVLVGGGVALLSPPPQADRAASRPALWSSTAPASGSARRSSSTRWSA